MKLTTTICVYLNSQPSELSHASSPGCAIYGLAHVILYPQGLQFIMRDLDIGDGVSSMENTAQAIQLAREACTFCNMGRR